MDGQAHDHASLGSHVPVWNLLDRRDPAWKALYSLYSPNGDQGRASGLQYSLQNRQAVKDRVAARAAATAAAAAVERAAEQQRKASPKPKVAVPHFRRRGAEAPADALAGVPHRKPGQLIKAAMESEAQQAWGQVPLPSGRLIDEQEKQRCALLMQFKGNIPQTTGLTPAGRARVAAVQARSSIRTTNSNSCSGSKGGGSASSGLSSDALAGQLASQRAGLQQRFEEVEQELAERQEFVEAMQQLGSLQQHLGAVRAEAAGKVTEMRQLDGQIKELDVQLRQLYSEDS